MIPWAFLVMALRRVWPARSHWIISNGNKKWKFQNILTSTWIKVISGNTKAPTLFLIDNAQKSSVFMFIFPLMLLLIAPSKTVRTTPIFCLRMLTFLDGCVSTVRTIYQKNAQGLSTLTSSLEMGMFVEGTWSLSSLEEESQPPLLDLYNG